MASMKSMASRKSMKSIKNNCPPRGSRYHREHAPHYPLQDLDFVPKALRLTSTSLCPENLPSVEWISPAWLIKL